MQKKPNYLHSPSMKSDACVQSTNDFSSLSKASAASISYVSDQFQKYFVSRTCRRSPLIHRGYCVRAQAITHCLLEFIQDTANCPHRQVLSLGCGFDSLYFRTCGTIGGLGSTCIWEVDFPTVVQRKSLLIDRTEALKGLLKNLTPPGTSNGKDGRAQRWENDRQQACKDDRQQACKDDRQQACKDDRQQACKDDRQQACKDDRQQACKDDRQQACKDDRQQACKDDRQQACKDDARAGGRSAVDARA
ncbi:uncharacterized protein ACNLHF_005395, partial [Anomaloglossus baeobatrachus]|uniref:uncharacterized protein LOC142280723 n=1 Tax=Anomaloglossus baeobatrachus TaxID=238106 RepID=UPI003F4FA285